MLQFNYKDITCNRFSSVSVSEIKLVNQRTCLTTDTSTCTVLLFEFVEDGHLLDRSKVVRYIIRKFMIEIFFKTFIRIQFLAGHVIKSPKAQTLLLDL